MDEFNRDNNPNNDIDNNERNDSFNSVNNEESGYSSYQGSYSDNRTTYETAPNSGINYDNRFNGMNNSEDLKTSSFYNESYKKPAKGRLKGLLVPMLVVALLSSLLTGGIVGAYFTFGLPQNYNGGNNVTPQNLANQPGNVKQIEIVDKTTSAESAVAEKVGPSIVGINVSFQYNDMFFGSSQEQAQGSGIIYRSDGYIVTNNHVIEAAMLGDNNKKIAPSAKIEVILPNQQDKPYEATVIGRDPKTDIAVLKINASELPVAQFADSDQVKIGERAIAIGNPAGLEFMGSVTSGIISGLNRKIEFENGQNMRLIQTDAAINPGNSGGALLNTQGQVIGINTSKIGGEGYEGLGFAIPSNNAKTIAESLIKSGYVAGRPQLGISVDTRFNKAIADKNNVPEGILVSDVAPLSGAYKAGIQPGDIITKFDDVTIKTFDELEAEKDKHKAGDKVKITLYRIPDNTPTDKGEYKTVEVTLGEDKG